MFSKSLFVLVAVAAAVNAQIPGLTPCVVQCSDNAAKANNCKAYTDIACVCGNQQLQSEASACLQHFCPGDVEKANSLQSYCAGVSISQSVTAPQKTDFYSLISAGGKPTASPSPTPAPPTTGGTKTSTGTHLDVGVGSFFGAVLAAVFAL